MPATLAECTHCAYRFQFDYDFRQSNCQRCGVRFDWTSNPMMDTERYAPGADSLRTHSATDGRSLEVPKFPGEK